MRRLIPLLLACMAPALPAAVVPVIVYHDVVHGTSDDPYAVRASDFRAHMNFLRRAGYHPIRLADYVRAANDDAPLPEKPILLTFDDGLASFQDIVLPVLEEHGFPAVLSVTTGWLDGRDVPDNYRGRLLTAAMLQAVSRSPLVEVLSHTDRLHQGLVADPYGSLAPAAITRRYLGEGHYESEVAYRQRVRADLQRSRLRLTEATGRPPAGITWPYGHHNSVLIEEAAVLGMSAQLVLDDALADTRRYPRISRRLLFKAKNLASFEEAIHPPSRVPPARLLEVRLDELVVASGEQQRRWLDRLVEQVRLMRVDTAIVSPFSRDRRAAFFANPVMPARADLLHRALHVLRSAGGVGQILLRLPPDGVSREVYTELARRHPYDGIVLSGAPTASTAADEHRFHFSLTNIQSAIDRGVGFEYCLPGAHSDIGGGYREFGDENLTLRGNPNLVGAILHDNYASPEEVEKDRRQLIDAGWYTEDELPFKPVTGAESDYGQLTTQRPGVKGYYSKIPLNIMAKEMRGQGFVFIDEMVRDEKIPDSEQLLVDIQPKLESHASGASKTDPNYWRANREPWLKSLRHDYLHFSARMQPGHDPRIVKGQRQREKYPG